MRIKTFLAVLASLGVAVKLSLGLLLQSTAESAHLRSCNQ